MNDPIKPLDLEDKIRYLGIWMSTASIITIFTIGIVIINDFGPYSSDSISKFFELAVNFRLDVIPIFSMVVLAVGILFIAFAKEISKKDSEFWIRISWMFTALACVLIYSIAVHTHTPS